MPGEQFAEISFYIVAHADDWQLFMQPNACYDLVAPAGKVVFIVTTAGDAGGNELFWAAREEGMKSSIRFCLAPLAALSESIDTGEFNNHNINFWSVNNVTCYFLRLPDGNLDGSGFSVSHYESLSKLRTGQTPTISAIDNTTIYNSWPDFCTTLQTIIQQENRGISNRWINYLNPNNVANPNDHTDHITTGQAIQDMSIISTLQQALYVGYSVCTTREQLTATDLFWKAGMFAAYEKAVYDHSDYSTLKEDIDLYRRWCLSTSNFIITRLSE